MVLGRATHSIININYNSLNMYYLGKPQNLAEYEGTQGQKSDPALHLQLGNEVTYARDCPSVLCSLNLSPRS